MKYIEKSNNIIIEERNHRWMSMKGGEGLEYRPLSEAGSLIIQVTIGCSYNKCTFCSMYKGNEFRIKDVDSIKKELREARVNS